MSVTAASTIRTAHKADRCATLGPGARAVIWVQGCLRACPGCIAPDLQPPDGGREATIASLAEWLLAIPDIDGLTLSGGEPMEQAAALAELIEQVAGHRDLTTWCYTGYTLEQLVAEGNEDRLRLLALLDVLVDGPYVEDRHTDLLWRGSDNQRILPLTPRGRTLVPDSAERGRGRRFPRDGDPPSRFPRGPRAGADDPRDRRQPHAARPGVAQRRRSQLRPSLACSCRGGGRPKGGKGHSRVWPD